ncbi:MAG: hypothetical protein APF77_19425 [Clostridia bacterium BRH_c25]|nr:MAG: hypothetical protein APF77_19425 [Clostridia bacterium BRH_c25]
MLISSGTISWKPSSGHLISLKLISFLTGSPILAASSAAAAFSSVIAFCSSTPLFSISILLSPKLIKATAINIIAITTKELLMLSLL